MTSIPNTDSTPAPKRATREVYPGITLTIGLSPQGKYWWEITIAGHMSSELWRSAIYKTAKGAETAALRDLREWHAQKIAPYVDFKT